MLFPDGPKSAADANRLVIQVQPAEGMQLQFETKVPDAGMRLRQTALDFRYQRGYRRLLRGEFGPGKCSPGSLRMQVAHGDPRRYQLMGRAQ